MGLVLRGGRGGRGDLRLAVSRERTSLSRLDGCGTPRTFAIRTFGCQMNEHDSERLAGLLVADGLVAASSDEPTPT